MKEYLRHLVSLWKLGSDDWIIIPPFCFVSIPIGIFVTAVFTVTYILAKVTGQPIPDKWLEDNQ